MKTHTRLPIVVQFFFALLAPMLLAGAESESEKPVKAVASNVYEASSDYRAALAVDGDPATRWACDEGVREAWLEIDFGSARTFDRAVIKEAFPERVQRFELQFLDPNGEWKTFHSGTTLGENWTATFEPVKAQVVRLMILEASEGPTIWECQFFSAAEARGQAPYQPVDGGIARVNGRNFYNRPLYCNGIPVQVLAGDLPAVRISSNDYVMGHFLAAYVRGESVIGLQDFARKEAIFRYGLFEWRLQDDRLGGTKVVCEVVPAAEGAGFAVRVHAEGAQPGDRIIWLYGGAGRPEGIPKDYANISWFLDPVFMSNTSGLRTGFRPESCAGNQIALDADGFLRVPDGPGYGFEWNSEGIARLSDGIVITPSML